MYATVGSQSHEMHILSVFLCIRESRNDFRIFQNTIVSARTVDFHQVLINYASCTDIQVSYL